MFLLKVLICFILFEITFQGYNKLECDFNETGSIAVLDTFIRDSFIHNNKKNIQVCSYDVNL